MSSEELFKAALKIRDNSHSPYSQYKVASAVKMDDGNIYTGINVENCSYGATICAERSAICTAISAGAKKIESIVIVTNNTPPGPPCGMCMQVISEFADKDTQVHLANTDGVQKTLAFSELMPIQFSADFLS